MRKLFTFVFIAAVVVTSLGFGASHPVSAQDSLPPEVEAELARLAAVVDAVPDDFQNPHPAREDFKSLPAFGAGNLWTQQIVNTQWQAFVNGDSQVGSLSVSASKETGLQLTNSPDPLFGDYGPYYNNAALFGFQGFMPTESRDVEWTVKMKFSPDFQGTAGFVVEPQNTFDDSGNFTASFDLFGLAYSGPDNATAGLACQSVVGWQMVDFQPIFGVDPTVLHEYTLRLSQLDQYNLLGTVLVDGVEVCSTWVPNYGPTEVQLWNDNYALTFDPVVNNFVMGFGNPVVPQTTTVEFVSAKAVPVP